MIILVLYVHRICFLRLRNLFSVVVWPIPCDHITCTVWSCDVTYIYIYIYIHVFCGHMTGTLLSHSPGADAAGERHWAVWSSWRQKCVGHPVWVASGDTKRGDHHASYQGNGEEGCIASSWSSICTETYYAHPAMCRGTIQLCVEVPFSSAL